MSIQVGSQFPYPEFRRRYSGGTSQPVIWQWEKLAGELAAADHTEYGTLTLSMPDSSHEILPGTAMTFQVVQPGGRTTPHSHSWWHLYFARAGAGSVIFDESGEAAELTAGDILLIPAWSVHHFENRSALENMVLLSMTNLPQQADLWNLISRDFSGEMD